MIRKQYKIQKQTDVWKHNIHDQFHYNVYKLLYIYN